jgi:hypothetical protein
LVLAEFMQEILSRPLGALLATAKTIRKEPDLTEGSIEIIMKHGRLDQWEIAASLYDLMRNAFVPALDPRE